MLIADTRTNTTIVFREIHKAIPTHAYVFTRNSSLQTAENNKTHSTDQCLLISSILLVHEKFARRTVGKQQKRRFILLIPSSRCKQIIYIISTSWKYTFFAALSTFNPNWRASILFDFDFLLLAGERQKKSKSNKIEAYQFGLTIERATKNVFSKYWNYHYLFSYLT